MKPLQPNRLILIGASTGGPKDIKKILKSIPNNFRSSIVIAQHMSDDFISSFAFNMAKNTHLNVKVAQNNETLKCNTIYVASKHCQIIKQDSCFNFKITTNKNDTYNPNINKLFSSCSHFSNDIEVLACILTGIGDDGAQGMLSLSKTNALCVVADQSSSAVYGMPLRAREVSNKVQSRSLDEIIKTIQKFEEN